MNIDLPLPQVPHERDRQRRQRRGRCQQLRDPLHVGLEFETLYRRHDDVLALEEVEALVAICSFLAPDHRQNKSGLLDSDLRPAFNSTVPSTNSAA